MSTTTMHFGPEWMRTKQQPQARPHAPPSPPPSNPQSGTSTYSALVSAVPTTQIDKQDEVHPFRYTKEELLRIFKEFPKASLGLEVERWEGVIREAASDPIALREMGDSEKKLFAGPLNSDLRRRQSTDYLSPLNVSSLGTERTRLNHNSTNGPGSPLRDRYPGFKRRDSNADSPNTPLTRKQSLSSLQSPSATARGPAGAPSPRVRQGFSGGFDGVLGAGETWSARRRTSEASLKPGIVTRESSGGGESSDKVSVEGQPGGDNSHDRGTASSQAGNLSALIPDPSSLGQENGINHQVVADPGVPAEPKDLAAVEWSYKDPSGNIQGPFRADLMQKWYDDGYFAPNLPMKRVQYDPDWITVAELTKRAATDKVFLSALRPLAPPGLTKREASPLHSLVTQPPADQNIFNNPYQPAPLRSLRSNTLDSFHGSNPSDSPSSSIGHFGNNSPDPHVFAGIGSNGPQYMGEATNGLGFTGGMDLSGLRRTQLQDLTQEPHRLHSPSYGNLIGGHGFTSQYNAVQTSPWGTPSHDPFTAAFNGNYNGVPAFAGQPGFNAQVPNQILGTQINPLLYGNPEFNQAVNQFNTTSGIPDQQNYGMIPQGYGVPQYQQALLPTGAKPEHEDFALRQDHQLGNSTLQTPNAWMTSSETATRRTGPFEATHPTTLNTSVPISSSQSSPWAQPQQPVSSATQSSVPKDASSWVLASHGILETPWTSLVQPESTPLEKLVEEPATIEESVVERTLPEVAVSSSLPSPIEAPSFAEPTPAPASKSSKKSKTAPTPLPVESPSASPAATPVTPAQKAPWAKDDKKKSKSSGTTISLRDIQDAEAKAAEMRKAKEEKERASRLVASASDSKEDIQPFTTSWGLPTSQAGGRSSSYVKDVSSSAASTSSPVPPVWTNAAKSPAVKKSMKEIQEEERRKQSATKETVATAAATAKRAYAESTTKMVPSATATTSSAWVTVGSNGKTNPILAVPPRPSVIVGAASSSTIRPNSTPTVRSITQPSASKSSPSPAGGKIEDFPVSPSHEFLKWLSESLKGLNSSVNVEEIISMLLSFSLDPDPVTLEIIQETIYANSTTLDGRRFATEFVAKRKTDAAGRKSGSGVGKAIAKPISIAEVVKATPKASQPEWGGFKVVNKKKKGGRS